MCSDWEVYDKSRSNDDDSAADITVELFQSPLQPYVEPIEFHLNTMWRTVQLACFGGEIFEVCNVQLPFGFQKMEDLQIYSDYNALDDWRDRILFCERVRQCPSTTARVNPWDTLTVLGLGGSILLKWQESVRRAIPYPTRNKTYALNSEKLRAGMRRLSAADKCAMLRHPPQVTFELSDRLLQFSLFGRIFFEISK